MKMTEIKKREFKCKKSFGVFLKSLPLSDILETPRKFPGVFHNSNSSDFFCNEWGGFFLHKTLGSGDRGKKGQKPGLVFG